jgi:hypothetical protein
MLRAEGWEVVPAVGPDEGLRALERLPEVDGMIVGGPAAFGAREKLAARLHARNPYAPVLIPRAGGSIGSQLLAAFGGEAQ